MHELGSLQKEILMTLYKSKDELHVNELARRLEPRRKPITVSESVKQLEDLQFVSSNNPTRGKPKILKLAPKGEAALFVYLKVDPLNYYSEKGEQLPVFLQDMLRLFPSNKKLAKRLSLQAFEFAMSDMWTATQGDKVIYDGRDEKKIDMLMALIHSAKFAAVAGEKIDMDAYLKLLDRFESQAKEYVKNCLEALNKK